MLDKKQPVLTAEGLVPIEVVSAGGIVWAENPEGGEQSLSSVVQTFENETEELVHVTVEGNTITSTPHHPFYSLVKGWTDALDLRAGDILVRSNGEYVIVEQVQHEILENPVKVYNFEVQDYHTYYVGCREVLVHNTCGPDNITYNPKQVGKKFGKHKLDYPNMKSHSEYVERANGIFKSPDRIVHDKIQGEYYYLKGKDLLRVKENGSFVSLYPGARTKRVLNAIRNGG